MLTEDSDLRGDTTAFVAQDKDRALRVAGLVIVSWSVGSEGIEGGTCGLHRMQCLVQAGGFEDREFEQGAGTGLDHQRGDLGIGLGREDDRIDMTRSAGAYDHTEVLGIGDAVESDDPIAAVCGQKGFKTARVRHDDIQRHTLILFGIFGDTGERLFVMGGYLDTPLLCQSAHL